MKLQKLENYYISDDQEIFCDLLIAYDCLEPRSSNILKNISFSETKIFIIKDTDASPSALQPTKEQEYKILNQDNYSEAIRNEISHISSAYRVIIDISCLPRTVMAEILSIFSNLQSKHKIELIVLYSLAKFTFPNTSSLANESIEPVHKDFAGWSTPETKPTSLILGLGYEPNKAEGASEYFEPSDQWIFVPSSPIPEFLSQVHINNGNLIRKTGEDRMIEYSVTDPEITYGQIELVISSLIRESNPVLLPFGPKIFFFLCLVQCLTHPELGVWRVSGVEDVISHDIQASEYIIGVRCIFS